MAQGKRNSTLEQLLYIISVWLDSRLDTEGINSAAAQKTALHHINCGSCTRSARRSQDTRKVSVCHRHRCLSFSRCPALVIRLASPEVNQSSRHGAKQSSDLRPKTDVSAGLPHRLAPVWGEPEIVFAAAGISSIQNGFITDGHRDTILLFFSETANALFSHSSRTSIRLR